MTKKAKVIDCDVEENTDDLLHYAILREFLVKQIEKASPKGASYGLPSNASMLRDILELLDIVAEHALNSDNDAEIEERIYFILS